VSARFSRKKISQANPHYLGDLKNILGVEKVTKLSSC
jgi:hypothetical protein